MQEPAVLQPQKQFKFLAKKIYSSCHYWNLIADARYGAY